MRSLSGRKSRRSRTRKYKRNKSKMNIRKNKKTRWRKLRGGSQLSQRQKGGEDRAEKAVRYPTLKKMVSAFGPGGTALGAERELAAAQAAWAQVRYPPALTWPEDVAAYQENEGGQLTHNPDSKDWENAVGEGKEGEIPREIKYTVTLASVPDDLPKLPERMAEWGKLTAIMKTCDNVVLEKEAEGSVKRVETCGLEAVEDPRKLHPGGRDGLEDILTILEYAEGEGDTVEHDRSQVELIKSGIYSSESRAICVHDLNHNDVDDLWAILYILQRYPKVLLYDTPSIARSFEKPLGVTDLHGYDPKMFAKILNKYHNVFFDDSVRELIITGKPDKATMDTLSVGAFLTEGSEYHMYYICGLDLLVNELHLFTNNGFKPNKCKLMLQSKVPTIPDEPPFKSMNEIMKLLHNSNAQTGNLSSNMRSGKKFCEVKLDLDHMARDPRIVDVIKKLPVSGGGESAVKMVLTEATEATEATEKSSPIKKDELQAMNYEKLGDYAKQLGIDETEIYKIGIKNSLGSTSDRTAADYGEFLKGLEKSRLLNSDPEIVLRFKLLLPGDKKFEDTSTFIKDFVDKVLRNVGETDGFQKLYFYTKERDERIEVPATFAQRLAETGLGISINYENSGGTGRGIPYVSRIPQGEDAKEKLVDLEAVVAGYQLMKEAPPPWTRGGLEGVGMVRKHEAMLQRAKGAAPPPVPDV